MNEGASKDSAAGVSDAQTTQLKHKDDVWWTSAFKDAWSKRSDDEKKILRDEPLVGLLEQLRRRTEQDSDDSRVQRILDKSVPTLKKCSACLKIAAFAASANNIAGAVMGTAQGLFSVCLHSPIPPPILGVLTSSDVRGICRSR